VYADPELTDSPYSEVKDFDVPEEYVDPCAGRSYDPLHRNPTDAGGIDNIFN
jgi:penicillin-binding protein 1A